MKSLVLLAVKRPVAITVAAMMIIILGIISWRNLSVDLFPDLQSPTILISLSSGDRPALEMERIYGERMEQLLFTVRGQNGVEQVARTGHLITRITFNWGTDTDLALVEVNKAVAALESDPNVDEVQVRRFDPRQLPIVRMGLTSENPQTDLAELRKMVERHVA
ncbi:MAG: efflux RND transporter permease subunit, partial [Exilibacterium sp.]